MFDPLRITAVPALAMVLLAGCGGATGPGDVRLSDPEKAVAEARRLIAEKKADVTRYPGWIAPDDLPASLRIPGILFGRVFVDHLNLVLARNSERQIGARIWAADARQPHNDRKTSYPDVMFFQYSNDLPSSPDNLE